MYIGDKHIFAVLVFGMLSLSIKAQEIYTLRKALQTAKINNPTLKAEQYNIGIVQSDLVSAKIRPNPVLANQTIQIIGASHLENNTQWNDPLNRQVVWQLTKPLQIAGQRRNKIDVANKNISLAGKNYAETERNLFLEVAGKWLDVWIAQKQLDIIRAAKNNIDSLSVTNQLRYKNQVITQTEVLRTEILAKQFEAQIRTANQELVNQQNGLKLLLGVQSDVNIDTADNFLFTIPEGVDSLLSYSLTNRGDVQVARSLVDVSESNIRLQKSLAIPPPEIGFIWNPQNAIPYIGISASIELPFFNRNQGEIRKAFLLKEQAMLKLTTVQTQVQSEIATAYANYQIQQKNIESFRLLLRQSRTVLNNVKYAYIKGGTTVIDFLEAQRSWLEMQQQYYYAIQQYKQSYIQLLYATGLINQLAL